MKKRLLAVAALSVFLAACGDGPASSPRGLDLGRFEGSVSGAVPGRLSGIAVSATFGVSRYSPDEQDVLILVANEGRSNQVMVVLIDMQGYFHPGRFPIDNNLQGPPPNYEAVVVVGDDLDNARYFLATTGELEVSSRTSEGVRGALKLSGREYDLYLDEPLQATLQLNADFNASYEGGLEASASAASAPTVRRRALPALIF